ncbi:MAG: hypothetical protein FuVV1_gp2 [Hangzhou Virga-like virus 1]|nr:MAG: hypothetical protein FuVV1_gp2 [Hangzhou Virga-like virus 1]
MKIESMFSRLTTRPLAMVFVGLWVASIAVEFGLSASNPFESIKTHYKDTIVATIIAYVEEYSSILPVLAVCGMGLAFTTSTEMMTTVAAVIVFVSSSVAVRYPVVEDEAKKTANKKAAIRYCAYISGILFGYMFSPRAKDRLMFIIIAAIFVTVY